MKDAITQLAKKFISIPSVSSNTYELDKIFDLALLDLSDYTIEKFEKDGIKSALIYNTKTRPSQFKILLNAHLDVVPGRKSQYKPQIKANKLYGVGALDMKANAACMILVFQDLAKKLSYPIALQLTTDEELGGFNGTNFQIEKGVRADFVIAGETTNFKIANKSKGILWLTITAKGKTAHGAYPWKGKNAISQMSAFIQRLEKTFPNPSEEKWVTTMNLSSITSTNQIFNKIPDNCTLSLDIRYIPEDKDKILKIIKNLLPKDFSMDILVKEPAHATDQTNMLVQQLKKTAESVLKKTISFHSTNGSSDVRHFARVGGEGVEFGSIGSGIGSDEEWINIESLEKYYEILKTFLLSLS